jgi:hypothetical protein
MQNSHLTNVKNRKTELETNKRSFRKFKIVNIYMSQKYDNSRNLK